jgi:hypothetical protein
VKCINTGPVNQTFSQYAGIGGQHLKLVDGNQVDRHRFDDLIEYIVVTDESFVIENGSATFIALWHSMIENSVIDVLGEAKRHARISIDRIKFAIRHSDQFAPQSDPARPLNRPQSAERHFQQSYPCVQCATDVRNPM